MEERNNNIAKVLDVLGEKIASLESDLRFEQYRNADLASSNKSKDERIAALEAANTARQRKEDAIQEYIAAAAQPEGQKGGAALTEDDLV